MSSSADSEGQAPGGFRLILVATVIAGLGGYVITTVVARALGEGYSTFAVFWSALYLVIGALSGIQQEVTRASHPGAQVPRGARPFPLAVLVAAVVAAVTMVSAVFWGPLVFAAMAPLAIPVSLGAAGYVFVAVFSGVLYGRARWRPLAVTIVLDVVLRLGLLGAALLFDADVTTLAWLTVVPLPLVALAAVAMTRGTILTDVVLDVTYSGAAANISRTVVAAAATAVLVSGFPLLIGVAGSESSAVYLSALIFALTLTRAPLVVSTLALQSYLVVHFRDGRALLRRVAVLSALLCGAGLVLAGLAWWCAEPIIVWLAGEVFRLPGGFLALLVLSSVPTAIVAITGAAVLARSQHWFFSAGWIAGALSAVVILFIPGELGTQVLFALGFGPLVGVVVHLIGLLCQPALERLDP